MEETTAPPTPPTSATAPKNFENGAAPAPSEMVMEEKHTAIKEEKQPDKVEGKQEPAGSSWGWGSWGNKGPSSYWGSWGNKGGLRC